VARERAWEADFLGSVRTFVLTIVPPNASIKSE
jgi:hypothetical protein